MEPVSRRLPTSAAAGPGAELLLDLTGFDAALAGADLVITGEGSLDRQTLPGKAPVGVGQGGGRAPECPCWQSRAGSSSPKPSWQGAGFFARILPGRPGA